MRRVIEPLLRGDDEGGFAASNLEHARDIEYVRDLGLIARQDPVRMANPIYAEVVPRESSPTRRRRGWCRRWRGTCGRTGTWTWRS